MEVIYCEEKSAYIKRRNGKFELVRDKTKATQFSCGDARRFIANQIPKKQRRNYSVEEISSPPDFFTTLTTPTVKSEPENKPSLHIDDMEKTRESIIRFAKENTERFQKSIGELTEKIRIELTGVDNEILDYRHWIRDKTTSLNAVQGYRAYKLHTELERKREELKKTFQLCGMILQKAEEIQSLAENFDYEPYKPRTDLDFDELIKGNSKEAKVD